MCSLPNRFLEEVVSEQKQLTPAEIYRLAAEIYESLPENYRELIISALVNLLEMDKKIRPLTRRG